MYVLRAVAVFLALSPSSHAWSNVDVLDLAGTPLKTAGLGFAGGFAAGGFVYLTPYQRVKGVLVGKLMRFNQTNWTQYEVLDLKAATGLAGFSGGLAYGDYAYFTATGEYQGAFVRVNLKDFNSVDVLDLKQTDPNLLNLGVVWRVGEHAYTVTGTPEVVRVVRINLGSFGEVQQLNLKDVDPALAYTKGTFTDSKRYGFSIHQGKVVRFGLAGFPDPSSVSVLDLRAIIGLDFLGRYTNFEAGFAHGAHGYVIHLLGVLVRFDLEAFDMAPPQWLDLREHGGGVAASVFADRTYAYVTPTTGNTVVVRVGLASFGGASPDIKLLPLPAGTSDVTHWEGFHDGAQAYLVPTTPSDGSNYTTRLDRVLRFAASPPPKCTTISREMLEKYNAQRCG